MKSIYETLNNILAEWDPLNVGEVVATDEYRGLIPVIISNMENRETLKRCLEDALITVLEVAYDKHNSEHEKVVYDVVEKIMLLNSGTMFPRD